MKLRDDFLSELSSIQGQSNRQISVSEGSRRLRCEVDQSSSLAASVYELVLETIELAQVEIASLQLASQSLCNRVNYLLEPISPIETDADSCIVQMRSSPPQQNDTARNYYELILRRGGSIALYRYEKQPGAIRSRVAVTLTHEVLGRLVDDFIATVDEVLST